MTCMHPNTSMRLVCFKERSPVMRFLLICPPRRPSTCTTWTRISSKDSASCCKHGDKLNIRESRELKETLLYPPSPLLTPPMAHYILHGTAVNFIANSWKEATSLPILQLDVHFLDHRFQSFGRSFYTVKKYWGSPKNFCLCGSYLPVFIISWNLDII